MSNCHKNGINKISGSSLQIQSVFRKHKSDNNITLYLYFFVVIYYYIKLLTIITYYLRIENAEGNVLIAVYLFIYL